jgi:hypothetical protein
MEEGMESFDIVKDRFKAEALAFPGLMHILMVWPKKSAKPEPPPEYRLPLTVDGIIYMPDTFYRPSLVYEHWIFKSECENWHTTRGLHHFETLAKTAGELIMQINSERIKPIRTETLAVEDPVQRWLLLLHDFKDPAKLVAWDVDDEAFQLEQAVIDVQKRFISVIEDVFLESVLACCWLMKRLNNSLPYPKQDRIRWVNVPILKEVPWRVDRPAVNPDINNTARTDYVSFSEAAAMLAVTKGTISRWVAAGNLKDNGQQGRNRKISKVSILLHMDKQESQNTYKDVLELRRDAHAIK